MGGFFEAHWSVNPHWTPEFKTFPDHPVANGVKPFKINDEWYYHMRFRDGMKGVTPILSALPGPETLKRRDGAHSGNPHVRASVLERKESQHVVWATENETEQEEGLDLLELMSTITGQMTISEKLVSMLLHGSLDLRFPRTGYPVKDQTKKS